MGSVNQIEPSAATTASFGEFSFLPLYLSAMIVIEPSLGGEAMTWIAWLILAAGVMGCAPTASLAVEGFSAAGPIGGTDIRSAQLPPPGLYGGGVLLYAEAHQYIDGNGNVLLPDLDLTRKRVGPCLFYVPDAQVFGGSIALAGIVPAGAPCCHAVTATPKRSI